MSCKILRRFIDDFLTLIDAVAIRAMKILAASNPLAVPVVAGESGTGGAGLTLLAQGPDLWGKVGLDGGSRVLLINLEGITVASVYRDLTGEIAVSVLVWPCARLSGKAP